MPIRSALGDGARGSVGIRRPPREEQLRGACRDHYAMVGTSVMRLVSCSRKLLDRSRLSSRAYSCVDQSCH